jgi:hypothetical protein
VNAPTGKPRGERHGAAPGTGDTTHRPRSSNTRPVPPVGDNAVHPCVLQTCVDWLEFAYRVVLDPDELLMLRAALGDSPLRPRAAEFAGESFELCALDSAAIRFSLKNASKTVIVGEHISGFWVTVAFRALYLRTAVLAGLEQEAERIVRVFAVSDIAEVLGQPTVRGSPLRLQPRAYVPVGAHLPAQPVPAGPRAL